MKTEIVNTKNRILSEHIRMTLDTRHTDLNNNVLVVGGSGSGKTYRFVKPQLLQMTGSYIITDPKGELYRDTSNFLRRNGYAVKALNLLDEDGMKKSSRFNPFRYIQNEVDVLKLITNLITNTTPKGAQANDPFWEKAEGMLLQALFYYVWLEGVPKDLYRYKTTAGTDDVAGMISAIHDPAVEKVHNVRAVMELLKYAEFKEDPQTGAKMDSTLDCLMRDLERREPDHKAVINYNKVMRGAADTVRSIIISANARLAPVQSEAVLDILEEDEIDIPLIGTRKTAVYCVIPDNDTTYNFLVGILYSMMFQRLYYEADFVHAGALPVNVTFLLDEFDNVALPENFLSLLSTMRSRNISSVIIIQDLSQIKTRYKDGEHEKIQANCDVMVYLGGNGANTQKELSELMGKATIDKKSSGETLGKQGNSTRNYDVVGRELMFPDELRKLSGTKCLLFIRGFDPVLDDKIQSKNHPLWTQMCEAAEGELFDGRVERFRKRSGRMENGFTDPAELAGLELLEKKERRQYEEEKRVAELSGEAPPKEPEGHIFRLSFAELGALKEKVCKEQEGRLLLDADLIKKTREETEEQIKREEEERERERKSRVDVRGFQTAEEAVAFARLKQAGFSEPQIKRLLPLVTEGPGMDAEEILQIFDPELDLRTVEMMAGILSSGW